MSRIRFKIEKIQTIQFASIEALDIELKHEINTEMKFGINPAKREIGVFANFKVFQEQKILLTLEVLCTFTLKKATWEGLLEENKITFPGTLMRHISMLTVGTARGILHAKTENTAYNAIILPTINLQKLIPGDMLVDFTIGQLKLPS